jgi:predicted nucleic acid-binding protein
VPLFYLDASAWAKRYTGEQGWDVMDALFDDASQGTGLISSALSRAEVISAFTRFRNRTALSDEKFDEGLNQLSLDGARLYWLRIGDDAFRDAILFTRV